MALHGRPTKRQRTEGSASKVWMEEYDGCGCTFVGRHPHELPGYCGKHTTTKKSRTKIRGAKLTQGWCRDE